MRVLFMADNEIRRDNPDGPLKKKNNALIIIVLIVIAILAIVFFMNSNPVQSPDMQATGVGTGTATAPTTSTTGAAS
jgi:flagellar basal body-associated protein FliL